MKILRDKRKEKKQLDETECFIALIICSTCFGHLYAHHQELETVFVLLQHMVCNTLFAGSRLLRAEQQAMRPGRGKLCDCCRRLHGQTYIKSYKIFCVYPRKKVEGPVLLVHF